MADLSGLIEQVLVDVDYERNPYFEALRDDSFAKDDFIETQIQFYFAVAFFSRPMAAVAAKIPSARQRVEILRNVWEEHGEGATDDRHESTFLELLSRLGDVTPDDVAHRPLWPEVRSFNTTLSGACVNDEYLVGVAVMGIIERMFADISSWIGTALVERGWLEEGQVIHYSLHRELDVKHAQDFFDAIRAPYEASKESRYYVEQGLRLGAYAFYTMYEGLFRARARRWTRELIVPHART